MHLYLGFEQQRAVDQRLGDRWANLSRFIYQSFQAYFSLLTQIMKSKAKKML